MTARMVSAITGWEGTLPDGVEKVGAARLPQGDAVITLPNIITFARLCAVPLAIWLILRHEIQAAFFIFVAAGLSDALDGWLARRQGGTALGALLDPLADKALLIGMYVTLAAVNLIPDFITILVVFRDLIIMGGVVLLSVLGQPVAIRPLLISKLNTALQITLIALVLALAAFGMTAPALVWTLVWLVATTTLVSGAAYVWKAAHA